jgi:hypothetical protein
MRSQIAFYGSTPAYRGVLELHGWEDLGAELTVLSKRNRWAEMAGLVGDDMVEDMVETFGIVAAPADLPARLAERFGGLATRIAFNPPASFSVDQTREIIAAVQAIPGAGSGASGAVTQPVQVP